MKLAWLILNEALKEESENLKALLIIMQYQRTLNQNPMRNMYREHVFRKNSNEPGLKRKMKIFIPPKDYLDLAIKSPYLSNN